MKEYYYALVDNENSVPSFFVSDEFGKRLSVNIKAIFPDVISAKKAKKDYKHSRGFKIVKVGIRVFI